MPMFTPPRMRPPNPSPYRGGDLGPETPSNVSRQLNRTRQNIKWGSILAGIIAVGTIAGGVLAGVAVAQTYADGGVRLVNERITANRGDFDRHVLEEAARTERQEAKQDRLEQKVDVILDALRVPMSRRPELADGGR